MCPFSVPIKYSNPIHRFPYHPVHEYIPNSFLFSPFIPSHGITNSSILGSTNLSHQANKPVQIQTGCFRKLLNFSKKLDSSDSNPGDAGFAMTFVLNAARISSRLLSFHWGYPLVLSGYRTRFSSRMVKSSIRGGGEAVMMSNSTASCRQYVSSGRSLTSWPKGFSISTPMVARPMMMYAATSFLLEISFIV